jgi:hypothetical protein
VSQFKVEAISRKELRQYALDVRCHLGISDEFYFPVVEFLESMGSIFPNFYFEVVEDEELPEGHAVTDLNEGCIRIRRTVYDRACKGYGRDRMTIAHEIGHYLTLIVSSFKLYRTFDAQDVKSYEDPEWQAKCFAGELLVPAHLINGMTISDIAQKCGVSKDAAQYQLKSIQKEAH